MASEFPFVKRLPKQTVMGREIQKVLEFQAVLKSRYVANIFGKKRQLACPYPVSPR